MYKLVDEELARANSHEHKSEDSTGMRELRAHLYRLQRLILSLVSRFQPQQPPVLPLHQQIEAAQQHSCVVQIAANVMLYTRNQVSFASADHTGF